jgi:hypothetical protein
MNRKAPLFLLALLILAQTSLQALLHKDPSNPIDKNRSISKPYLRKLQKTDQNVRPRAQSHLSAAWTGNYNYDTYLIATLWTLLGLPLTFLGLRWFKIFIAPLGASTGLLLGRYIENIYADGQRLSVAENCAFVTLTIILFAGFGFLWWWTKKHSVLTCGVSAGLIFGFMTLSFVESIMEAPLGAWIELFMVLGFGVAEGVLHYWIIEPAVIIGYSMAGSVMVVSGVG